MGLPIGKASGTHAFPASYLPTGGASVPLRCATPITLSNANP